MTHGLVFLVTPADALTAEQRTRLIALCTAAYEEPFDHLFASLPGSTHVLAHVDGEIVGHAAWVTRWLQPDGHAPLRTAYVEAVATAPAHRRRGFASATLRELQRHVADYELAALSPSDAGFYARLGWESWRGPLAIRTTDGVLPTPDEEVMILRLARTPPLDVRGALTAEWRDGELW